MDAAPRDATPEDIPPGANLTTRLVAELAGTALFVAVGTGAATILALGPTSAFAQFSKSLGQAGAGGAKPFEALFTNSLGDVFPVAIAFGFALAVLFHTLRAVSGAHFNPAVTFGLAVTQKIPWNEVPAYWGAQIAGGIVGAFVVAGIYGQHGVSEAGHDILLGASRVGTDVTQWQGILAEAFVAFLLVTAVMAVTTNRRARVGWSGLLIGLALSAGMLVTWPATQGAGNFARSIGPLVASLPFEHGEIPWGDLFVYAVGPLIGGAGAAIAYGALTGLDPSAQRGEAATIDEPPGWERRGDREPT